MDRSNFIEFIFTWGDGSSCVGRNVNGSYLGVGMVGNSKLYFGNVYGLYDLVGNGDGW